MNKYQPRPINSTLDKQKQINTVDQNVRDVYKILNNLPQLQGASGVVKRSELLDATMMALDSSLNIASTGFLYQTGAAAFSKYPFAGSGSALSVAHSDHTHAGVYATGSLSVGKIPYCSNATGPVLSDSPIFTDGTNITVSVKLDVTDATNHLKYDPTTATLSISGPATTLSQMPRMTYNFNGDADAALGYMMYSHDNVAITFDSYHNGTSWVSSNVGSNYSLYKNADLIYFGVNSGTAKGSTFAAFANKWSLNTSGNVIQAGTLTVSGTGNSSIAGSVCIGTNSGYGTTQGLLVAPNLVGGAYNRAYQIAPVQTGSATGNSILMYLVPTISTGITQTNLFGAVVDSKTGSGSVTNYAGLVLNYLNDHLGATNGTGILMGQIAIPSGNYSIYDATGDKVYISGNVGIGYTAPLSALCVNGGINIGDQAAIAADESLRISYNSTYHAGFGSDIYNNMHVLLDYASGGRFIIRDYTDTHDYAAFGPTLNTIYTPTNFSDAVLFASTLTVSGLSTAGIVTNTSAGLLGTTSFGTTAGTVCEGNDSRLSALSLTTGYIPKAASATTLGNSPLYTDGTNVGLGTTAPEESLEVANGSIYMSTDNNSITTKDRSVGLVKKVGYAPQFTHSNNIPMYFSQLAATTLTPANVAASALSIQLTIDNSGNVGIGYTAPLSALCVNGGVNIGSDAALASGLGITLSSTADNKTFSFLEGTTSKAYMRYYGTAYATTSLRGLTISSVNNLNLVSSGAYINLKSSAHFNNGVVLDTGGSYTDDSNGGEVSFYAAITHTIIWSTTAPTSDLVVSFADTPSEGAIIFIHSFNQNDCVAIHIGGNMINGCCGYNQRSCMIKYANGVWCKVSDWLGND